MSGGRFSPCVDLNVGKKNTVGHTALDARGIDQCFSTLTKLGHHPGSFKTTDS